MTMKDKMHSCELYFPNDEEIMWLSVRAVW